MRQETCSESVLGSSGARRWSVFRSILDPQIRPKANPKGSLIFERFLTPRKKPGYHGTGSARDQRASSTACGRRGARASEKRKDRSTSTERSSKAREARASLAASRRDCTIAAGLSHARCARALGRLEWGSSLNFLKLLSGRAPWIARKRVRPKLQTRFKKCPPRRSKIKLRRLENLPPEGPK